MIGKVLRLSIAGALGALVVLLPAVAGSETVPSITAYNGPPPYSFHYWEPSSATVAQGGTVAISNNTNVAHGVHWLSEAKPECSGVIVGDRKSTRLNSSHEDLSRMPSSA